ncbi:iron complex transport system substrate-binding protein [Friedmanniella endophytica]|uniref:Iron complex transport system substrate-binding protein n=1 Tax=Microlunatus kandeliicorticis TaxID=1759536 RepID=A0A7W3IS05_9ACTN|nr:ABC transporter substrate-binding protein [Microlunatus kandeliicorticis]MBA8794198.1 iron complex transport system substrate-binding protein [Microlunatus kandeliicorticis]
MSSSSGFSRRRLLTVALPAALSLPVLVACQSDPTVGNAPSGAGTPSEGGSGAAGPFPVTIEHQFGSTTVPAAPTRVLTAGFNEQDFALAFGVEPVGVREFLGYDAPQRPWAPASVRGKQLPTVGANELDFEKVAALDPDLILAVNAYIDRAAYEKLAAIAPTVAQSGDVAAGATSWQDQTRVTGRALGREQRADELVTEVEGRFAAARSAHPAFAGKSAAFALGSSADGSYSLGADDYRTGWLVDLGFMVPRTGGDVSFERLDVFDADVLIGEGLDRDFLQNRLFTALDVVREKRFVDVGGFDQDFAGALGFNSPLSLPFLLDQAVPKLATALQAD